MSRTTRNEGGKMPPSENLLYSEQSRARDHSTEQLQTKFLDSGPLPSRLLPVVIRQLNLLALPVHPADPASKGVIEAFLRAQHD